jgi:pimeloyl-ACP methyl ester carboxylesterase
LIHELLTQLKLSPAILVGHSFGGSVALGVARRYPADVARLVPIAPAAGGMRSNANALLQARYLRFSQLPVVESVIEYNFGNVALRRSAHFGARGAFEPAPVDPTFEARLIITVGWTHPLAHVICIKNAP